jgi:hypothetical protein
MKDSSLILQLSPHKREHTKKETHSTPFLTKLKKRPTKEKTVELPLHHEGVGGWQGMEPVPNVEKGNFN